MFSYLLPSREDGELLLTFADCSKISDSPCQAQAVLSPASIKVPQQGICKKIIVTLYQSMKTLMCPVYNEETSDFLEYEHIL